MPARSLLILVGLAVLFAASSGHTQAPAEPPAPKFPDYATFLKGSKVIDGMFTLHQKDEHLYAEIGLGQLDRPYLVPMAIAKGAGVGGATLNFGEQWIIVFKRVGDKVFVIRRNTKFTAKAGTPAARAMDTTYSDSILMALPIKTVNPLRASIVIDFNSIFFSDFGDLGIGYLDRERTTWNKVKGFKKNVELQVAATFSNARTGNVGGAHANDAIADTRGATIIVHYGIVELPEPGYSPRNADDRVGHFTTVLKDFSKESTDTAFVRYVNRWRLERADGSTWKEGAKLVPPKKKIVFWIENSVPDEYRAAVREGILEWNKAFEKIGFRDAIEVRQQESEDFDPEDITYSTFRWITSEVPYAIGPSRANPFTGELLDADILFDASMVRSYKGEARMHRDEKGQLVEPASNIQASRRGWDLPFHPLDELRATMNWNDRAAPKEPLRDRLESVRHGYCQCAHHKMSELGLALMNIAAEVGAKDGDKLPDELLQQAVKEVVMHEVGHTLGLRHNFKASTMLPNEQLHDTAITGKRGLVGSVMDYTPANIAPKGTKQGHYFTPTIGAYDYWAIEYAYTPNGSDEQLAKVASRCAEPGLIYGTDEDLYGSNDPHTNQWDLGADTLKFAKDRVKIAQDLIPKLAEQAVDKGEGYQRARAAFGVLMNQYGNASALAAKHIGGAAVHRDHKGDDKGRDPFVPTSPAKQRESLKFLQENILTDKPFDFPPELLRKLGADRWVHWGNERAMRAVEFPLYERILGIQRVVLIELLDAGTLSAVQTNARMSDAKDKPLELSEVFRALTDSTFADGKSSVIRRNLQREYVGRLSSIVLGKRAGIPADAKSLARLHLKEIGTKLADALPNEKDDTAKAHFDELHDQIAKVLDAKVTTEP
jgi:hypothetical protein